MLCVGIRGGGGAVVVAAGCGGGGGVGVIAVAGEIDC